ncbi:hypothetical protein IG631_05271 [Alternaria alternata]|nr:hypothetical protein IG631_05271 [Alternaria alternata]
MRLPRIRLGISVGKFPQPGTTTAFSHSGETVTTIPSPISRHIPVAIKLAHGCFLMASYCCKFPARNWDVGRLPVGCATSPRDNRYHEGS